MISNLREMRISKITPFKVELNFKIQNATHLTDLFLLYKLRSLKGRRELV